MITEKVEGIEIISDLHLERLVTCDSIKLSEILARKCKYLAVVGDICNLYMWPRLIWFFDYCSKHYENIFYVLGNHEYYTRNSYYYHNDTLADSNYKTILITKMYPNVHILDNKGVLIGNNLFFGTTLWSRLPETYQNSNSLVTKKIRISPFRPGITVNHWNKMHSVALQALNNAIEYAKENEVNLYVMTHYAPTFNSTISKKYIIDKQNCLYCTELSNLFQIDEIKCWIFGHTGHNCNYHLYGTQIVSNQYKVISGNKYNKNFYVELKN